MPLWRIFHPQGTFADVAERTKLAQAITELYVSRGLPPFYVNVIYINTGTDNIFRGGQLQPSATRPPHIRIVFDHIARRFDAGRSPRKLAFFDAVNATLEPFVAAKGWDWELHGEDTEITMSRLGGFEMPPEETDVFRAWRDEDRPVPYEWRPEWVGD